MGLLFVSGLRLPAAEPGDAAAFFDTEKVWPIHLEMSADEYDAMQPPAPAFGFGGPGGPGAQPPQPAKPAPAGEQNLFGTLFPWAEAAITVSGRPLPKVAVRYAGDGAYFASAASLKRPLRVEFDRHDDQSLFGLRALDLHAGTLDPSRLRETMAFEAFRAAGIPASRTTFAEVTLTVPGRFDDALLGLYTVVEAVDATFAADRFHRDDGLLMKPRMMRGIDDLGNDWPAYVDRYRPRGTASDTQSRRVIDFVQLVNGADDATFARDIEGSLDVEGFLKFLAVNALTSNLESFFALGSNYWLYLDNGSGRIVFLPSEMEFSMANFLMMGTADQLMNLSVLHPYPGENRLTDRLLSIEAFRQRYLALLHEMSSTINTPERQREQAAALATVIEPALTRETAAREVRGENAQGFGPPGGMFPQPPDLATFAEKRAASIQTQLTTQDPGYLPQFNFGPPPPAGGPGRQSTTEPVTDESLSEIVTVPDEFDLTLYAGPPDMNYPVAVAATPTGEVYVAVDEQGSLGRTAGGGRIVRCLDTNHDGKADQFSVFAKMEHPRGVVVDGHTVWVLNPPNLTRYQDDDGDGISDSEVVLVTGLTTRLIDDRGGDHTTNGIRLGIDGWIYIGVGDYGILEARGSDGTTLSQRGGGILRVRPDGSELEVFATGLRNPFDIAIDPWLNLFTRDNSNDGAGWDIRVSHLVQTAQYGYTQLYANFADETMPPLGQFGNGGGTGSLYIDDPLWPEAYRNHLYTGDWGRSELYRHTLKDHAPTFDMTQDVFATLPRATGMDSDGCGHLYAASWRGGDASVFVGPNVGFIARISPRELESSEPPDVASADRAKLIELLTGPSGAIRLSAQRELLRRGRDAATSQELQQAAAEASLAVPGRIAALFTLKQLDGPESHTALRMLAADPKLREFALKALTDRKTELGDEDVAMFVAALSDESPWNRAQAIISLSRIGDPSVAAELIPLTSRPGGTKIPAKQPVHAQPDPDRVIPHLAVRALVALNAVDACLAALEGPHSEGALRALRSMHTAQAVDGLVKKLATSYESSQRRAVLSTLIRLLRREKDYDGSWWGIRPDNTGPYFDAVEWEQSARIDGIITRAVQDSDPETATFLVAELSRHQVELKGLPETRMAVAIEQGQPIVVPKADPANPNQIGNMEFDAALTRTLASAGNPEAGRLLFTGQNCRACHTDADGQVPKGPHLVEIGKRLPARELVESILKPSAKIAQGFETNVFAMSDGRQFSGFVVRERADSLLMRDASAVLHELKHDEIDERGRQTVSTMPEGIAANLAPEQLADLIAYLQSL